MSVQEIKQIESFVLANPHLANPNCFNIGNGPISLVKISPLSGLIIVKGNEFTGFEHIHSRHEFFSIVPYWTDSKEASEPTKKKLQDQSRFRPDSVPFYDYINIADSVYKPENKNVESNKRQDIFDLYVGYHENKDGTKDLYKLLLYKDSKVIHTFYPQASKNNKKRISNFNFARGIVRGTMNYQQNLAEITIPYSNDQNKIKYSILIRKNLNSKIEEANILIHDEDQIPQGFVSVAERSFNDLREMPLEILIWQHADLRNLEEYIKKIEKQINEENNGS